MKKILVLAGALVLSVLLVWVMCEISGSEYYNYRGYVISTREDDRGNTVITTVSGVAVRSFVIRSYTREKYVDKDVKEIEIGDRILLTTTQYSDSSIKKMSVSPGYSTSGKLVYVEGQDCPFVLVKWEDTGERALISAIFYEEKMHGEFQMGDMVNIYHMSPVSVATETVVAEAITLRENGDSESLTDEDIAFIESEGYSIEFK